MPKTDRMTFAVSQALKTGMLSAGNYAPIKDLDGFYMAQNALWVALGMVDGGLMRATGNTSDLFDLFDVNDPDIMRAWAFAELTNWFTANYVYDNYLETQSGGNFTISFTVDSLPFSGTANTRVNALAEAVLDLLASSVAVSGQKGKQVASAKMATLVSPSKTIKKK